MDFREVGVGRKQQLLACAAVVVCAFTASVAQADDAAGDAEVEAVVVTGERARARRAIVLKREAPVVYDAVVADDIGRLPDLNVSDSFRRIPGASTVLDEDEGRFVTVRGLSAELNYVTIDGLAVATHDAFGGGGRSVNLEVIPNSAVSRLEIFKSFTPDMDGHAVGGYLNLVTRSALDQPGFHVAANAQLARYSLRALPTSRNHDPEGRASLTLSNTFGDDRFGALLSLSYDRKARDETKIIPDGYSYFNAAGQSTGSPLVGNGFAAPNQFRFFIYDDELQRVGAFGRLDARWTDAWSSSLSAFLFRQENAENRYGHQLLSQAGISNQTATSGTYARGVGEVSYSHFPIKRRNAGVNFSTTWRPDTQHRLDLRAGYAFSDFTHDTPNVQFRTAASPGLGMTYDTSRLIPSFTVNTPAAWADTNAYTLFQYDLRNLRTDEEIWEGKADYAFNADGPGLGFVGGVGYRVLDRRVDNDQQFFTNPAQRLTGLIRDLDYTPPGRSQPYLFFDYDAFESLVRANPAAFQLDRVRSIEASLSGDFKYRERIGAAYGAVTYAAERWRVIAGGRFEKADVSTDTYIRDTLPTPDVFRPTRREGDYDAFLPSFNATLDLTEALRLRLGASRSVGRPNPSSIGQQLSVSTDGLTVTLGNPDLKPRRSRNLDLSLEYTFDGGDGLLSVALFHKKISDEIVTLRSQGSFEGRDVTFVQPANSEEAEAQGVEIAVAKGSFDFLPAPLDGFGFTGNVAFIDGRFSYASGAERRHFGQLISQPKQIYNASLFYTVEDHGEVRLAYHRAGRNYSSVNTASPWLSRGTPAAEQWDLSARYDVTPEWSLRFEVRNLTNEDQFITEGPGFDRLIEQVDYGRSVWFGVTFRR
jgi:iron complex outermembrane receptor protein